MDTVEAACMPRGADELSARYPVCIERAIALHLMPWVQQHRQSGLDARWVCT